MKRLLPCLALALPALAIPATPFAQTVAEIPFVVEQTYWIKPGRNGQFIALFKKTRLPTLQAELASGRLSSLRLTQPQLSANKDQWSFRVTQTWKNRASALEFAAREKPADSHRRAMEEQLREELVTDRSEVLVVEQHY
ncbi:hypothetical protein EBB59_04655 [Lysobacter pythonis]|uniref:ABM domain-containing protein n=1 Tax=Solilutibacter pythonis TaxID=2483112 RepID=A0A3M2I4Y6_9GAMM|nr:hypothetical protein [Lysobacter pythonis]RMH93537.1 hypothetical protein EBB59_04655 [Lysobacter pythonis]